MNPTHYDYDKKINQNDQNVDGYFQKNPRVHYLKNMCTEK